jgi:hypothetical protein
MTKPHNYSEISNDRAIKINTVAVGIAQDGDGPWHVWVSGPSGINYYQPGNGTMEEADACVIEICAEIELAFPNAKTLFVGN